MKQSLIPLFTLVLTLLNTSFAEKRVFADREYDNCPENLLVGEFKTHPRYNPFKYPKNRDDFNQQQQDLLKSLGEECNKYQDYLEFHQENQCVKNRYKSCLERLERIGSQEFIPPNERGEYFNGLEWQH